MKTALEKLVSSGARGAPAADRLCVGCVEILGVEAAAISVIDEGASRGTVGASHDHARILDELQFTYGEGPCLEAARTGQPVLVPDLQAQDEPRWPTFALAAERAGVRAVFAIPIAVGRVGLGALDLFRSTPGGLTPDQLRDAILVAEAAAQILLDLLTDSIKPMPGLTATDGEQLTDWARLEVHQATGMIIGHLGLSPAEALVRLRAHAFTHDLTASEAAHLVVTRELRLEP